MMTVTEPWHLERGGRGEPAVGVALQQAAENIKLFQ
jgi:hypothetical protein